VPRRKINAKTFLVSDGHAVEFLTDQIDIPVLTENFTIVLIRESFPHKRGEVFSYHVIGQALIFGQHFFLLRLGCISTALSLPHYERFNDVDVVW
jgi:hypothetical protein